MNKERRLRRKRRNEHMNRQQATLTRRQRRKRKQDLLGAVIITACLVALAGWGTYAYLHDRHSDDNYDTHYLDWIGPGVER